MDDLLGAVITALVLTLLIWYVWRRLTAAGRARVAAARERLSEIRSGISNRHRPGPSSLGAFIGRVAAAAWHGGWAAWDAGWAGAQVGWDDGTRRFYEWLDRRRAAPPAPVPVTVPAPRAPEPSRTAPAGSPGAATPAAPDTSAKEAGASTSGTAPAPTTTEKPGVIMGTVEITSLADIRRELSAIHQIALSELDNGNSDMARASEEVLSAGDDVTRALADLDRVHRLADAAGRVLDNDPDAVARLDALCEPAAATVAAARVRVGAAEALLTAATNRVKAAEALSTQLGWAVAALNRHTAMEEATAGTPTASSKTEAYAPQ